MKNTDLSQTLKNRFAAREPVKNPDLVAEQEGGISPSAEPQKAAVKPLFSLSQLVRVDSIDIPNKQVRIKRDIKIEELAQTLEEVGLLESLLVQRQPNSSRYLLVAGERRLRAAKMNKWELVPACICDSIDDVKKLQLQLIENLQREDMSPQERKDGYSNLRTLLGGSTDKASKALGIHPSSFRRVVQDDAPADKIGKAASRMSIGQYVKATDKWLDNLDKMPKEKKEVLLEKVEALAKALRNSL